MEITDWREKYTIKGDEGNLHIKKLVDKDIGSYSCTKDKQNFKIDVFGKIDKNFI